MNDIIKMADGNMGAIDFLMGLFDENNLRFSIPIVQKLKECPTLKGTNLYVLFSDLCNRDYQKVMTLCKNCPNDILEDACSRQDRSGRALVSPYFN